MHEIWRALQWWDDWQLRILVLGSLGLQWFLLLAAPMRKFSIPRIFRTCIWLAIISSDALAIYALATLFNRHSRASGNCGNQQQQHSSSILDLEVLWAPVLLIHLGGQKEMAVNVMEDDALWIRHTVTLVSQVAVALYTFCISWHSSSDWKLLVAAVLLFVVGVASLSEKPFALNRAKINRQAALSSQGQGTKKKSRKKPVALSETDKVWMLLSDMSPLAAADELVARNRASSVEDVLPPLLVAEKALPRWLGYAFAFIYAPATVAVTPLYLLYHLLVVPILHMAALLLFAISDKNPYKRADVKITYIILCLTAALDVLQVFVGQLLCRLMSKTTVPALCQTVASYNLIDTALWEANNGWIFKFARSMRSCFCRPQHYGQVGAIVMTDLVDARGRDLASYRVFDAAADTNTRTSIEGVNEDGTDGRPIERLSSNWALSKELQEHCGVQVRNSLCNVSFDRSVLLWHIATDLCRRCSIGNADFVDDGGEQGAPADEEGVEDSPEQRRHRRDLVLLRLHRECAVAISDYMAHLLHVSPEMLMTGSRHHLISEAAEEVKYFFFRKKKKKNTLSQQDIEHFLAMEHKPVVNEEDDDSRVFHTEEASKLAKELMAMPDGTRWMLMYRVWLGMLCYSASMCRGNLHAKSLGQGGEFLSLVWLTLGLKGAMCLTDKLQIPPYRST
ncbi:hypothetical protein ACQ4PT_058922 [Festuca glaucescens]